jgi:hypothetical protein
VYQLKVIVRSSHYAYGKAFVNVTVEKRKWKLSVNPASVAHLYIFAVEYISLCCPLIARAGKKNFLPGSTTWRQKFPADQRSIFVPNLYVHKHTVYSVLADPHGFKFKE